MQEVKYPNVGRIGNPTYDANQVCWLIMAIPNEPKWTNSSLGVCVLKYKGFRPVISVWANR